MKIVMEQPIKINHLLSAFKLFNYFQLVFVLSIGILYLNNWLLIIICQMLLGLIFAHGLELQHGCIHLNMFRSKILNRIFGSLLGLPMLVSYTHYRVQHMYHHKYLGTEKDAELFNYEESSLKSLNSFILRAWNFARIPSLFDNFSKFIQGKYPLSFNTYANKREALLEYFVLTVLFSIAFFVSITNISILFWKLWLIPWLLFGEFFHFLIELPEHIDCDRNDQDIFVNTRSIETNPVVNYLVNGNNYHVEHHLYPNIPVHNLKLVHEKIKQDIKFLSRSYITFYYNLFLIKLTVK